MKIEYYGHACFKLISRSGKSIVIDPFEKIGYEMPRIFADILLTTHTHFDHCFLDAVSYSHHLERAGKTNLLEMEIEGIKSYHDEKKGALRGENIIFLVKMDNLTLCHMGDFGEYEDDTIKKLPPVDILFLPVGGKYTIDGKRGIDCAKKIGAKLTIPMHYKTEDCALDIATIDGFLEGFKQEDILREKGSYVWNEPKEKILVLERKKEG